MVISDRVHADRALLTLHGDLVRGCAEVLAEKLATLPSGTARIDVDMSGVRFMDAAGLEFLEVLRAHSRRRLLPVTLTRWNRQPRRVLERAGLDPADPLRSPAQDGVPSPFSPAPARKRQELPHVPQEEIERFRQALAARPVVDRARGILMARYDCTSDEAWHVLREAAQLSRTELRTVAETLVAGAGAEDAPLPAEVRRALVRALDRRSSR